MKKKLISMTIVLSAMLLPSNVPVGHGGRFDHFATPWTVTCTGPVLFSLDLGTRKSTLGTFAPSCPTPGTDIAATATAPTSWTWRLDGCYGSTGILQPDISGTKFAKAYDFNCWGPGGALIGPIISSGTVTVDVPYGVK